MHMRGARRASIRHTHHTNTITYAQQRCSWAGHAASQLAAAHPSPCIHTTHRAATTATMHLECTNSLLGHFGLIHTPHLLHLTLDARLAGGSELNGRLVARDQPQIEEVVEKLVKVAFVRVGQVAHLVL
jgi:hypothetical protein